VPVIAKSIKLPEVSEEEARESTLPVVKELAVIF